MTNEEEPDPLPRTNEARDEITRISSELTDDLEFLAEIIAANGTDEIITLRHVTEARDTLRRAGLKRPSPPQRFYQTPTFLFGVGTLLMGLAPTITSFAKDCIEQGGEETVSSSEHPVLMWTWMICVPFLVFGVGAFLAGCGLVQSKKES